MEPEPDTWMQPRSAPPGGATVPAEAGHAWLDAEAGPVVRPYTISGGRVRPAARRLDLVDYVVAIPGGEADLLHLQPEHRAILTVAVTPTPVAEVAAALDLAIGVVRVLIDDLIRQGLLTVRGAQRTARHPDDETLKAVINGLRSL